MALLDIQAMDPARDHDTGLGDRGSHVSVTLCDSYGSTVLCV